MSLYYHEKIMRWSKLLEKALKLGYLSHKTSTCGLHIHVNKNTFGTDYGRQEERISRVLYFVERHIGRNAEILPSYIRPDEKVGSTLRIQIKTKGCPRIRQIKPPWKIHLRQHFRLQYHLISALFSA